MSQITDIYASLLNYQMQADPSSLFGLVSLHQAAIASVITSITSTSVTVASSSVTVPATTNVVSVSTASGQVVLTIAARTTPLVIRKTTSDMNTIRLVPPSTVGFNAVAAGTTITLPATAGTVAMQVLSATNYSVNIVTPVDTPTSPITYYVASTGSDTTGDGTLALPFATPNQAMKAFAACPKPTGNLGTYGLQILIQAGFNTNWASASGERQVILSPIGNGPRNSTVDTGLGIVVQSYATSTNLGKTTDERWTVLQGPLTPSINYTTENGRPLFRFASSTFASTDVNLGAVVRVFNGTTGVERFRGTVAYARKDVNISGTNYDQLVVDLCGQTPSAAQSTDVVYICDPAVTISGNVTIGGTLDCNMWISNIKLSGRWTINTENSTYKVMFPGCRFTQNGSSSGSIIMVSGTAALGTGAPDNNLSGSSGPTPGTTYGYTSTEYTMWKYQGCGVVTTSYTNYAVVFTGGRLHLGGVFKGLVQAESNWFGQSQAAPAVIDVYQKPVMRGAVTMMHHTFQCSPSNSTNSSPRTIIGNAVDGFKTAGLVITSIDNTGFLCFDAATITGNAVTFLNNARMTFDYPYTPEDAALGMAIVAMDSTAPNLSAGQILVVKENASAYLYTSVTTLRGTGGTADIKVGAQAAISVATAISNVDTVDSTKLARVRAI